MEKNISTKKPQLWSLGMAVTTKVGQSLEFLLSAIGIIISQAFNGAGDITTPTVINLELTAA